MPLEAIKSTLDLMISLLSLYIYRYRNLDNKALERIERKHYYSFFVENLIFTSIYRYGKGVAFVGEIARTKQIYD